MIQLNADNFKIFVRFLMILSAFLFLNTFSFADVLYLKNGIRMEGKILEEKDNKVVLEIEINGKFVSIVFKPEEIEKIVKTELLEADKTKNAIELFWIANRSLREGEFDNAISYYKIAIFKEPDYADAYYGLGVSYQELNMNEEAENNLRKASTLYSKLEDKSFFRLAEISLKLGDLDKAIDYMHKAIAQKPDYINNYYTLGIIYFKKKEYDFAYYYLKKALSYAKDTNSKELVNNWLEKPELTEYREEIK